MRRSGIGSLESPLLARMTSASAMISEAVACGLTPRAGTWSCGKRVFTFTRVTKKSVGSVDLLPPAKVIIALVEKRRSRRPSSSVLTADLNVVDGRRGVISTQRGDIVPRMIDDVHLHAADTTIPFGPFCTSCPTAPGSSRSTESSRSLPLACVDRPSPPAWRRFSAKMPTGRRAFASESVERANLAHAQMIMLMGVGV